MTVARVRRMLSDGCRVPNHEIKHINSRGTLNMSHPIWCMLNNGMLSVKFTLTNVYLTSRVNEIETMKVSTEFIDLPRTREGDWNRHWSLVFVKSKKNHSYRVLARSSELHSRVRQTTINRQTKNTCSNNNIYSPSSKIICDYDIDCIVHMRQQYENDSGNGVD